MKTAFGYSIYGNQIGNKGVSRFLKSIGCPTISAQLEEANQQSLYDLRDFWSLEHIGILDPDTPAEEYVQEYFKSIKRNSDNRYVARLPWKDKGRLVTN